MTDNERERLRAARERAERHAADMDEAAKGGPKSRYFVDPKAAREIAEDLRDYGEIIRDMEKDLDKTALKDAVEVYRRDPQAFVAELSGIEFIDWPIIYPDAKYLPLPDWVRYTGDMNEKIVLTPKSEIPRQEAPQYVRWGGIPDDKY